MRRIALLVLSPIAVAAAIVARRMFLRRRALRAPPAEPTGEEIDAGWVEAARSEGRAVRERLAVKGVNAP